MGGTSANILRADTSTTGGTKGGLLKPTTQSLDGGNVNKPGNAKAPKLQPVGKGHGAEKKSTGDNGANKKSIVGGKGK
jgi:hypothetical protein